MTLFHAHRSQYRTRLSNFARLIILMVRLTFYGKLGILINVAFLLYCYMWKLEASQYRFPESDKSLSTYDVKPSTPILHMYMVLGSETMDRFPELRAFLNSLHHFRTCHLDFHLVVAANIKEALGRENITKYNNSDVFFYELPPDVEKYVGFSIGFRNKATMLKIMPEITLPSHVNELVIIDFDTLILHDICDALDVFKSFNEKELYGAAPEYTDWYYTQSDMGFPIPEDSPYRNTQYLGINAGVIFAKLDRFRARHWTSWWKADIAAKMLAVNDSNILKLGDQDVWNYMAQIHPEIIHVMPNYWNRQVFELKGNGLVKTYIAHGNMWMFKESTFLSTAWCHFAQVDSYYGVDCSARLSSRFIV